MNGRNNKIVKNTYLMIPNILRYNMLRNITKDFITVGLYIFILIKKGCINFIKCYNISYS